MNILRLNHDLHNQSQMGPLDKCRCRPGGILNKLLRRFTKRSHDFCGSRLWCRAICRKRWNQHNVCVASDAHANKSFNECCQEQTAQIPHGRLTTSTRVKWIQGSLPCLFSNAGFCQHLYEKQQQSQQHTKTIPLEGEKAPPAP